MHQVADFDRLTINEITKVEGAAGVDVILKNGKVQDVKFGIKEFKRFYTTAMIDKPIVAIPQLLARICGTCSTAHLTAAIEAVEKSQGIVPSEQTRLLRKLTYHGLIIRDHALHLYLFSLPDIVGKDSLLGFDDNDPLEHQLLHDAFAIKAAGNHLGIMVAGRSVHAPYPVPGGFSHIPDNKEVPKLIKELQDVREAVLRGVEVFANSDFSLVRKTDYAALRTGGFDYLEGDLYDMNSLICKEKDYRDHLEHVVIPYSQASGYTFDGNVYRVGALARMNINRSGLHPNTLRDCREALKRFPSDDIFDTNVAQAIAILHSVDESIDILTNTTFHEEKPPHIVPKAGEGVGLVEAPRGALYHSVVVNDKGIITEGEVIVPTGQNQIAIEQDLGYFVENNLHLSKETLSLELEKIVRAYDPCMSCASHFLTLNIEEV